MYIGNYMDRNGVLLNAEYSYKKSGGGKEDAVIQMDKWENDLRRFDKELERIKKENKREQERLQKERIRKKRIQKKIQEKLAFKEYLFRKDEIRQLNEKASLERLFGEDVYIKKAPLNKGLSAAELLEIYSGI